jgi:iron complex outermembrane receptor protein
MNLIQLHTIFFILICLPFVSFSQNDLLYLDTVAITAQPIKTTFRQIDSTLQSAYQMQNLGEILQQNAAIYIKTYGNGMLATPSLRGTTAAQTQVLWNGFSINSATLGQTDFSLVPIAAAEQIDIATGGDMIAPAIGGNVALRNTLPKTKGTQLQLSQEIASFGTFKTYLKANLTRQKWSFQQSIFRQEGKNNFPFFHPNEQQIKRQTNAAWEQIGALQHIQWRPTQHQTLTLHTWQQQSFRQIQPTFLIRDNFNQQQTDLTFRAVAEYQKVGKKQEITVASAYFHDKMRFEDPPFLRSDYQSHQWQNRLLLEKDINPYVQFKLGSESQVFFTQSNIYQANEWRIAAFGQVHTQFRQFFAQTALRYQYIAGFEVPILPIFTLGYQSRNGWNVAAKWQKNYRLPTLNERYWQPGGNPFILPETAQNYEGKVQQEIRFKKWGNIENSLTAFYIQTQNLIQWLPQDSYWQPENTKGISTNRGAEWKTKWKYEPKNWKYLLQYHFTYSLAQNEQGYRLMYAPLQQSGLFAQINYKKLGLWANYNYTSLRYTDALNDARYAINGFYLINVGVQASLDKIEKTIKWNAQIRFQVNNILNTNYQNYINRAMPLRNYSVSCIFSISHK